MGVLHAMFSVHTRPSLQMSSLNEVPSTAGNSFDGFMEHFSVKRNIDVIGGDHGLELRLVKDVKRGEELLAIPRRAVLEIDDVATCPCKEYITGEMWQAIPSYAKLAIYLLYSIDHADQDPRPLRDYFDVLPKQVLSTFSWSEEAIQELQDPYMIEQIQNRKRKIQLLFHDIQKGLSPRITYDRLLWAIEVLQLSDSIQLVKDTDMRSSSADRSFSSVCIQQDGRG